MPDTPAPRPFSYGPYQTEAQARAAALAAVPPDPGWSILRAPQCRELFGIACETAGIEPGAYGQRVLDWLAGFEDSACAVVADLITRAYLAGQAARPESAGIEWGVRFTIGGVNERPLASEEDAKTVVANMRENRPEFGAVLITRVPEVPAGPWMLADEGGDDA